MGIAVVVYDSTRTAESECSRHAYLFEDDLEIVLEGLAKSMRYLADPSRRTGVLDDAFFSSWLTVHDGLIRPFVETDRVICRQPYISACLHAGLCGCRQTFEKCSKILTCHRRYMAGSLGVAFIDVADPDCIRCKVRRCWSRPEETEAEAERDGKLEFDVVVQNTWDSDGNRVIYTTYMGPGVEVYEYINIGVAARLREQRAEEQRAEEQRAEEQRAEEQRAEEGRAEEQRAEEGRAGEQSAREQSARERGAGGHRFEGQRAGEQRGVEQRAEEQRAGEQSAGIDPKLSVRLR